ncbi:helix-turn-helix transcriptional regulator [Palleronia abyssalis]|uniref:HTH luxR-type domain-containing protein n=1 Tax=Palleronia abyssalis TaxID=1501240 RepID=A0A2R8C1B5_9RHOB|nr:hypothetical protein [Palleronia abyssalis]SPJ26180.1 hypothetical protein PAA8504_04036 [Palleronia abyssalis]
MRDLADALMETVECPASWEGALAALCSSVGAVRALITLRDLETADIYVPTEVAETYGSPLIHGFDPAEVHAYLSDYMVDDPWTEIEQRHPPVEPYAMSTYLPPEALRATRLWAWLEPLRIGDAVACEIGRTDRHRTILNLFLPLDADPDRADIAVDRLVPLLPMVRKAWAIGRRFQVRGLSQDGLDALLGAISRPTLVATCAGRVDAFNDAARARFASWGIDLATDAPLHLPERMEVRLDPGLDFVPVKRVRCAGRPSTVASISLFAASELCDGESVRRVLMTLEAAPAESIWEVLELTPRERELVRYLAQGLTHKAAAFEMGRSYPRIMQLWRSAREKLGVSDVNDLRVRHQLKTLRR